VADLDYDDWVTLQPQGDRLCQCACGCSRELMPEEDAMCSDCLAGRHPGEST
jgi:NMD protein affecting ribosome stability and mRNA decay